MGHRIQAGGDDVHTQTRMWYHGEPSTGLHTDQIVFDLAMLGLPLDGSAIQECQVMHVMLAELKKLKKERKPHRPHPCNPRVKRMRGGMLCRDIARYFVIYFVLLVMFEIMFQLLFRHIPE